MKKQQKIKTTVTLREIEAACPCWRGYEPFLKDMKSQPLPDGRYGAEYKTKAKSQFGPDDPINLVALLATKRRSSGSMTWDQRVTWILGNVASLAETQDKVNEAEAVIRNTSYRIAVEQVLGV